MSNESQISGELFQEIDSALRTPEQVPLWRDGQRTPTFKLLRNPVNLQELNQCDKSIAIWRDNGTLTHVKPSNSEVLPDENQRGLALGFRDNDKSKLMLYITGGTDEAIADTLDFFVNVQGQEVTGERSRFLTENCLVLGTSFVLGTNADHGFDFRRVQCLPRIFEVASRLVGFLQVTLNAEQAVVLATMPYSIEVHLGRCHFEDSGTAFVDALESRKSSFRKLEFAKNIPLDEDNLKRLLQVDKIMRLALPRLNDELALLPFSANVEFLEYRIAATSLAEVTLQSLNIVPDKLFLRIDHENDDFPIEAVLSFFGHVADLGHFMALAFEFPFLTRGSDIAEGVVKQLIEVTLANRDLEFLGLLGSGENPLWENGVRMLFEGLKDHPSLRFISLKVADEAFGPNFSHLQKLLCHDRFITVVDEDGKAYSDGSSIDELYSLNHFYCGSADLVKTPSPERPLLVAAALVERASKDFKPTALLLSNHTDLLCEWVQFADRDELDEHDPPPELQRSEHNRPPKRQQRTQPHRAAKRAANSST